MTQVQDLSGLFKETAQQVLNNKLHAKASTSVLSYGVTI